MSVQPTVSSQPWTALAAAVCAAVLVACAAKPGPVALSGAWPESPGEYREVHREWTRHGVLQTFEQQVIDVYATYKSPAWRAAYVAHAGKTHKLSAESKQALQEQQSKSAAETHERSPGCRRARSGPR